MRSAGRHYRRGRVSVVRVELFLQASVRRASRVFKDNEGKRHLAQQPARTSNPNHIDVRHHFLRELVFWGDFVIAHSEWEEQHSNFLIKPLDNEDFLLSPGRAMYIG